MNEEKIKRVMNEHDADKEEIRANVLKRVSRERRSAGSIKLKPILAACLALILIAGACSGYAISVEAGEYREAVEFFDEYKLSTEGLTRAEIKAVYKDISMRAYSYKKTIEILNEYSVEMYSTELGSLDAASLEALWNTRNNYLFGDKSRDKSGIWYDACYTSPSPVNEQGIPVDEVTIYKYDGDDVLWSYKVPYDMYIFPDDNMITCDDGVIIYGRKDFYGTDSGKAFVFMLDGSGEFMWEYSADKTGTDFEAAVVYGDEITLFGTRTLYGSDEYDNLFVILNGSGEVLENKVTVSDKYSRYDTAVRIDDYYLVKKYVRTEGYTMEPELISVSLSGEPINRFAYSDNGVTYQINDILYFGGKVYLSAQMPNFSDGEFNERWSRLDAEYFEHWNGILSGPSGSTASIDEITRMPDSHIKSLTALFSEAYSAVLLVCDDNAVITKAYSVENARAGELEADGTDKLKWQVMRIDGVKHVAPYISSRRVDIAATEFSFMFDLDGKLIEKSEKGAYPMAY